MPELPEVEIVRQSLDKKIKQKSVKKVIIRNRNLRFQIPNNFKSYLKNKKIIKVGRFSKYLIINFSGGGYCLIHLGMSGTIHILDKKKSLKFTNTSFYHSSIFPKKHNHVELIFNSFKVSEFLSFSERKYSLNCGHSIFSVLSCQLIVISWSGL